MPTEIISDDIIINSSTPFGIGYRVDVDDLVLTLAASATITDAGSTNPAVESGIHVDRWIDNLAIDIRGIVWIEGGYGVKNMSADYAAISVSTGAFIVGRTGISHSSGHLDLLNRGDIVGLGTSNFAVEIESGTASITNYGRIFGTNSEHNFDDYAQGAISIETNKATSIRNYGDIVSESLGATIDARDASGPVSIYNHGRIENLVAGGNVLAPGMGASLGSGGDRVFNSGYMDNVRTNGGNDFVRNTGEMGYVDLGSGNDVYYASGSGRASYVFANDGADRISGGKLNDRFYGGNGNDTIDGKAGNDYVRGGLGNDTILGGSGDDLIIGDGGQDKLTGGSGEDVFRFFNASESSVAAPDTITDFDPGVDTIHLFSFLYPSVPDFIGTQSFSGNGESETNYSISKSQGTIVSTDFNGDGIADFRVILEDIVGVTEDDFTFWYM